MAISLARRTIPPAAAARPDAYLTDGRRLFRVVEQLDPSLERPALLEDCMTLELHPYSPTELWEMGLREVGR
jgi:hypothetical protein